MAVRSPCLLWVTAQRRAVAMREYSWPEGLAGPVSLGTVPSASSLAVTGSEGFVQTLETGTGLSCKRGALLDLRDVLNAVRSGWWLLAGGLLLGLAVAGLLSWLTPPLSSSSTQLFVSVTGSTDTSAAYQGNLFSQQRVTSYAQLLTGEKLAAQGCDDLGLPLTPEQVARKVTATPLPDTVILEVTVSDTSADRAQDIAD